MSSGASFDAKNSNLRTLNTLTYYVSTKYATSDCSEFALTATYTALSLCIPMTSNNNEVHSGIYSLSGNNLIVTMYSNSACTGTVYSSRTVATNPIGCSRSVKTAMVSGFIAPSVPGAMTQ